ncbi:hypothetical protein [Microbulbifer sp.]|uniref:hypothetical protein n=1 Tax=Microbulbifer sp. TaxID=1908541 RepID=UPI003F37E642
MKFTYRLWLLLLGILSAGPALSQCNNTGFFLQICDLEGNHDISYDPASTAKNIDFQLYSRTFVFFVGLTPADYRVTVNPLTGTGFALFSTVDQADFSLTFQPSNGASVALSPGTPSSDFTGSTDLVNASLFLTLTNPDALVSNNYSGEFEFLIEQQGNCGFFGCQNLSVDFTVNLTVPTRIIVKNFNDMPLDTVTATPGNPIEGYEDICVGGVGFANYTVNLASTNGSTGGSGTFPFQLNGVSQNLPYTSEFIDNTSSTSGFSPDANGDISQPFPRTGNENCTVDNARVIISIAAADWGSANETSYTDTVRVTVMVE